MDADTKDFLEDLIKSSFREHTQAMNSYLSNGRTDIVALQKDQAYFEADLKVIKRILLQSNGEDAIILRVPRIDDHVKSHDEKLDKLLAWMEVVEKRDRDNWFKVLIAFITGVSLVLAAWFGISK